MRNLFLVAILVFALASEAATNVSITATFTNTTANGNALTIQGTTVRFTNAPLNGTTWITAGSSNVTATNFARFMGRNYPQFITQQTSSNVVVVHGFAPAIAVSSGAFVDLGTNSANATNAIALIPWDNHYATNRTNNANELFYGLKLYSSTGNRATFFSNEVYTAPMVRDGSVSNSVLTNIPRALITNAELLTATMRAGAASNVTLTNIVGVNGYLVGLTNGRLSNVQITNSPFITGTNLRIFGSGFLSNFIGHTITITNLSVPGSGSGSFLIGDSAVSSAQNSMAVGNSAIASNDFATAIGYATIASGNGSLAIGNSTMASNGNASAIAIGGGALVLAENGVGIGVDVSIPEAHTNSAALGFEATTTEAHQIRLGTAAHTVSIPGALKGTISTNQWTRGTNKVEARVDFTSRANSSLANGNNSGVILGSNVYVRLSGPSSAYTNAGFAAELDGSFHILQFDNPVNNMTILDNSGLDAAAANRIRTGTGGALNFTNDPVILPVIYDGTASRWRILNGMPYR